MGIVSGRTVRWVAMGIRQPVPNARSVIFKPGGAWYRFELCSLDQLDHTIDNFRTIASCNNLQLRLVLID